MGSFYPSVRSFVRSLVCGSDRASVGLSHEALRERFKASWVGESFERRDRGSIFRHDEPSMTREERPNERTNERPTKQPTDNSTAA